MSFSSGKEDDPSLTKSLASFTQEPIYEVIPTAFKQLPGRPVQPSAQPVPVISQPVPVVAPAQPQPVLLQIMAPATVSAGQQFGLEVNVSNAENIDGAPFILNYDPLYVEFVAATEGSFLKKDGKATTFSSKASPANGTVAINLARAAGSGGVSGNGTMVTLLFRAVKKGEANFGFAEAALGAADGKPAAVLPFSTLVEIK
jgi:general secretion pathway protein D